MLPATHLDKRYNALLFACSLIKLYVKCLFYARNAPKMIELWHNFLNTTPWKAFCMLLVLAFLLRIAFVGENGSGK